MKKLLLLLVLVIASTSFTSCSDETIDIDPCKEVCGTEIDIAFPYPELDPDGDQRYADIEIYDTCTKKYVEFKRVDIWETFFKEGAPLYDYDGEGELCSTLFKY